MELLRSAPMKEQAQIHVVRSSPGLGAGCCPMVVPVSTPISAHGTASLCLPSASGTPLVLPCTARAKMEFDQHS